MKKYKIVKHNLCGTWYYAIKVRYFLFFWRFLKRYSNGDVDLEIYYGGQKKLCKTEQEAKDIINNLIYEQEI